MSIAISTVDVNLGTFSVDMRISNSNIDVSVNVLIGYDHVLPQLFKLYSSLLRGNNSFQSPIDFKVGLSDLKNVPGLLSPSWSWTSLRFGPGFFAPDEISDVPIFHELTPSRDQIHKRSKYIHFPTFF